MNLRIWMILLFCRGCGTLHKVRNEGEMFDLSESHGEGYSMSNACRGLTPKRRRQWVYFPDSEMIHYKYDNDKSMYVHCKNILVCLQIF